MKFTVTKDLTSRGYLSNILILILISLGLFIVSYSYFQIHSVGFFPSEIKNNILGNEELFIEPKSFMLILEEIHMGIFGYIVTAVIVLMVFVQIKRLEKFFYSVSLTVMGLILLDSISQPLILVWEPFIYGKSIFFTLSNTLLLILICISISYLLGFLNKPKNEK
ncbi:MAG: hypothetical protein OIF32_07620 [Campylobacterales bacterium]|nr:hypothetical protein [Campylobacterales bacterium]